MTLGGAWRLGCTSGRSAVTQGGASGTGRRLWPVGALRTSAALVLIVLLSFAALAWLLMLRTSGADSMTSGMSAGVGRTDNMGMAAAGPSASMTLPLFLGMWVTMMVAMMFPSVAPMVIIYSRFLRFGTRAKAQLQSL
jgi:predicted metal-binding membrane protein